ncbi:hypothetical protein D3D01_19800 [Haloarcula sp. Atlit-7R]|nr:hypothetical protein D3D01_19800 [Haloarcula sp. Atlit-7R]
MSRTVDITLTRDSADFLQTETTVAPDQSTEVPTGITETGDYHLTVTSGEREDDSPVIVKEFTLRAGLDIFVF